MGSHHHKQDGFTSALIFILIIAISLGSGFARVLEGDHEQWVQGHEESKKGLMMLQSLQRGPVPPSGKSPCTYIPGRNSGHCTLNGRNFAGHGAAHAPPAFPEFVVEVGVASAANGSTDRGKQDSSS
ncbi:uncharacterized protein LOC131153207 [Malania oleifera]|uniref:uncharacterized protein LOC131153207 n=1 Tax=Malania oleifera TaxID=397392 RepID=UPI0025AE0157|nr:uncharacterized protein LOC131153207 [Malania oleifera]